MAENVNLTFDLKYLENGASDEKNYEPHFLCRSSRGIQRSLFQVDTTNTFRVMTENVDLTVDLWQAFRPEVELQDEAHGKKALC